MIKFQCLPDTGKAKFTSVQHFARMRITIYQLFCVRWMNKIARI